MHPPKCGGVDFACSACSSSIASGATIFRALDRSFCSNNCRDFFVYGQVQPDLGDKKIARKQCRTEGLFESARCARKCARVELSTSPTTAAHLPLSAEW